MSVTLARLDNGLTVLAEESHTAPVVALQAWVHVGSADESEDIAGVAHVHEHMLFKGTARRGVGEIARTVEGSGGEINAWTSYDQTVYHLVLAAEQMPIGLDILADALRNSAFDEAELKRELDVVVEEIRRAEDSPARRAGKAMFTLAYQRHPYRRPVIGSEASVRGLTRQQILQFFHTHYRPDRITLVATGDFRAADLVVAAERVFGDWRVSAPAALPPRLNEPEQTALRFQALAEPVKEARLSLAWHVPGVMHDDTAALDALSVVLGHGDSSRLYLAAQRQKRLVNHVYAYAYTPRDPGLLAVDAAMARPNLEAALAALCEETYRLRASPVRAEELDKAKVILLSDAAYQRETVQGLARKLGFYQVVAGDYAFEETYDARLRALTAEDIRQVAEKYLHDKPTLVVQVPEAEPVNETKLRGVVEGALARAGRVTTQSRKRGALEVVRATLPSGAVVLARREDSPVLAMRAVARGGLRWEDETRQGLSNLFSSVWGRSTEELSVEWLSHRIASLGGSIAAFSGRNTVGLRAEFVAEHGEAGMHLFLDTLAGSTFAANDLERERTLILEQIKNRDDNPSVVAFDVFARALFPNHPYGLRLVGSEDTVRRFTLNDVVSYSRCFVTADKLVVAVVGGMDPERAIDLVAARLAEGGGAALPPVPARQSGEVGAKKVRRTLDKKQAHIIVGAAGTTVDHPDRHTLEVLTTILSGQGGRLFLDLRDRQGLAYSLSSSSVEGLDPGYVLVHVATGPEQVERALAGVYHHLARLRDESVGAEELERAQRYLIGTHAIDLQRAGARAMTMALGELFGLGYDQHTRYAAEIRRVTSEAVQAAARHYLGPEQLVEAVVGPAA